MKKFQHVFAVLGIVAVVLAALLAFAPAQPAMASGVSQPAFQTTPPPDMPDVEATVVIPDTGDTDVEVVQDGDNDFAVSWWLLVLLGVGLVGLLIGLMARGGSHHHHID